MSEQSHAYEETPQPVVWALVDSTVGHANQVMGLAVKIGLPYRIKALDYTKTSSVPHKILGARGNGLTKQCRETLEKEIQRDMPKLIIAAGARTASPMRWLKKLHPEIKLVQILWPGEPVTDFDYVIVPKHDKISGYDNVIETLTSLHGLTQETLASEGQSFSMIEEVRNLPRPWVSCLVGGDSKHGPYSSADYEEMLRAAKKLAGKGSLMISNSRRSSSSLELYIKDIVGDVPHYFHDAHCAVQNRYMGILSACDAHVISGESVSMLSEAIAANLPIYVYVPDCLWGKETKINRFHDALIAEDAIKLLTKDTTMVDWQPAVIKDEATRVAEQIKTTLSL